MVHIKITFNTFNRWAGVGKLHGRLKEKLFNLYFMLYMSRIIVTPRVSLKKKVKRTIVVLKSPFHYKTPKHHIQYSYIAVYASLAVKLEFSKRVRYVLSQYFIQNKPHRIQMRTPQRVDFNKLL